MPRSVFGIPGLNPWNILFASVLIGWIARKKDKEVSYPGNIGLWIVLYGIVIFIASVRQIVDIDAVIEYTTHLRGQSSVSKIGMFNDTFINTYKYAIVGLLFFYGSDTEKKVKLGLIAIFIFNVLIALQVIKWMPIQEITNGDVLEARARRILDREIGYYRTDIAAMLAGAAWAIYLYKELVYEKAKHLLIYLSTIACSLGMALTGGRTGIISWLITALLLSLVKYRHIAIFLVIASVSALMLIPSVTERLTQGFNANDETSLDYRSEELDDRFQTADGQTDIYTVTAGRVVVWSLVIDKISEAPLLGYGRNAMVRTGIAGFVLDSYGEIFPHTHNAYLEMLLDNGIILSFPVFVFFLLIVIYSFRLFRSSDTPIYSVVGGAALCMLLSQLIASVGAQSFYPTEGTVSMWATIGILLRVYAESERKTNLENKPQSSEENIVKRPSYY